jgi:hypothetical protein
LEKFPFLYFVSFLCCRGSPKGDALSAPLPSHKPHHGLASCRQIKKRIPLTVQGSVALMGVVVVMMMMMMMMMVMMMMMMMMMIVMMMMTMIMMSSYQ